MKLWTLCCSAGLWENLLCQYSYSVPCRLHRLPKCLKECLTHSKQVLNTCYYSESYCYCYCRKYVHREANIYTIQPIKSQYPCLDLRRDSQKCNHSQSLGHKLYMVLWCFMVGWMIEKVSGRKMFGANLGEVGRQLTEKEEVARRDAKWSWWLPENTSGFLI